MLRHATEKFLSLDIRPDRVSGLYFELKADRTIRVEKFEEQIDLAKFLRSARYRAAQASWEGNYFFKGRRRIVAAADPTLATTIPIPFAYRREAERYDRPLTIDELDDQIAQAIPRILTQCRGEVAKRLLVEPIETVLVGARAANVVIDGKATAHPAGFLGKEVALVLELTFVRRDLFESFRALFNAPEPFFFFESPESIARAFSSIRSLPINLIVLGDSAAHGGLFVFQEGDKEHAIPVLYREPFSWGFAEILTAIQEAYGVSRPAAIAMCRAFANKELSPNVERHIGALVAPFIEEILVLIRKARLHGAAYYIAPYVLPVQLPLREGAITLEEIPLTEILRTYDLTIAPDALATRPDLLLHHLAPFLLMYFEGTQGALNERLRKKVHWLTG
jgi:hypothetical protein